MRPMLEEGLAKNDNLLDGCVIAHVLIILCVNIIKLKF